MAVAGLHNVLDFARPFYGESQKRDSDRWDDERCRRSTRASALLQMWREFEGEHVLSQSYRSRRRGNGCDSGCRSTSTSVGDGSENGDDFSQASDEFENQGFSGSEKENEDNNSVISEQSSDLGEIERGRVRQVFREWTNICPKGHGFSHKNNSGHCIGDMEHERVRDSLVTNHLQIGARRPFRKLCGRQTLLDLILKTQKERERELRSLSEQRPVSDFAHSNRIQALLRGRFLRNGRLVVDEKPSSVAATELGFLRERNVVSDLRDGFLSKLDSSASTSVNGIGSETSCSDRNKGEPESTSTEGGISRNQIAAQVLQEIYVQTCETEEPVLDGEACQEDTPVCATSASCREESTLSSEERHQVSIHVDLCEIRCDHVNLTNESSLETPNINFSGSSDENNEPMSGVSSVQEVADRSTGLEGNMNAEFLSHDDSTQAEESQELVTETEDSSRQHQNTVPFTEQADGSREEMHISDQERASSQTIPTPAGNNVTEHEHMQELHDWPHHDLHEAIENWLDIPSGEAAEPVREVDTFYFPFEDEDNANNMELRELFSRRRVSSLLRSSFRDSLNQVLHSHAERLGHASIDWELDSSSFPLNEQDQEQLSGDQSLTLSESVERNAFTRSSTHFEASQQQLWNEEMQSADWSHHYSNQQLETERDVINALRIDLARIEQRMDNMQGMLEACVDMQIELQRSLHQEVSAALNRSLSLRDSDSDKDNHFHDESRLDHVKRGVCCLCQHSKINSLLYRCGHMCTCTGCAESLVRSKGKCPMCRAPAVEAVRAYFVR